jgi:hypothetical protein
MTRFAPMVAMLGVAATAFAAAAGPAPPAPTSLEDVVQTTHATVARTRPEADAPVAFEVPSGTELTWVVAARKAGYYRVIRRGRGPQGWIPEGDLKVVRRHEPTSSDDVKACSASLDQCPARGCADEGSAEAADNAMKRVRPAPAEAKFLTFQDLDSLQRQADERVGQGPNDATAAQHAALHGLSYSGGSVSEGDLVRIVAFIPKASDGLHANMSGESVNCNLKHEVDNDFHIPVVESPPDTEFRGIVVEMIPQDRPKTWTIDALKGIQAASRQVWIEGALFYDKVHFVVSDPDTAPDGEPQRMSLWEIHPITKFLECTKEHCDPQRESDWSELRANQKD